MSLLDRVLGSKKAPDRGTDRGSHAAANATTEPVSREAALVAEALKIIEAQVKLRPENTSIEGTGAEGKVMEAVRKLGEAHRLHPSNALLHYAYASALDTAMQFKSAAEE